MISKPRPWAQYAMFVRIVGCGNMGSSIRRCSKMVHNKQLSRFDSSVVVQPVRSISSTIYPQNFHIGISISPTLGTCDESLILIKPGTLGDVSADLKMQHSKCSDFDEFRNHNRRKKALSCS